MPARGPTGGRALCTPHSLQEQSLGGVGTPAVFVSMAAGGLNSHPRYSEPAAAGQRVTVGRTSPPPHLLWTFPVPPSLGFHGSVWQRGIYFKTLAGMPGGSRRHAGLGVRGDAQQMSAHSARVPSKASYPSPPSRLTPVRQGTHYYPILQMRRLRHRAKKGHAQGHIASQWQSQDSNSGFHGSQVQAFIHFFPLGQCLVVWAGALPWGPQALG